MACERVAGCPLYKEFRLKVSQDFWVAAYCEGDFERCARRVMALKGEKVPPNLLPNGTTLAGSST